MLEVRTTGNTNATYGFKLLNSSSTTMLYVQNDGNVGIGTSLPLAKFEVVEASNSGVTRGIVSTQYDNGGGNSGRFVLRTSNGTAGAPSAIVLNNGVGSIVFQGYDGTAWTANNQAGISVAAAENWSTTNRGTNMNFYTTVNGAASYGASRLTIHNSGNIGINSTVPTALLDIVGDGSLVLLPRKSTTGNPAGTNGAIYYNTFDGKFMAYENGVWSQLVGNVNQWSTSGNALAGGEFLGSTTAQNLVFKANNIKSGLIDQSANGETFFGYESGKVTTGISNTAFGFGTLKANVAGEGNSVVGYQAGLVMAGANNQYNTYVGYQAGLAANGAGATDAQYNTFIGEKAGLAVTTGSNNTYIGAEAGKASSTATNNLMVGYQAGTANTATENTFVGYQAGLANVAGTPNTLIGFQAGARLANADNEFNTMVGYKAGYNANGAGATAQNNTLIGHQSGYSITTGNTNTAVGANALYSNLTGTQNTAIGYRAGYSCDDDYNTFVGMESGLYTNGSGGSNVFVGLHCGRNHSTGTGNVCVGVQNMLSDWGSPPVTYSTGSYNTIMGFQAGQTLTTGSYNVLIGYQAQTNAGNASKRVAIGYQASANVDNSFVIGAAAGSGNELKVGIGSTSPAYPLDITNTTTSVAAATFGAATRYFNSTTALTNAQPGGAVSVSVRATGAFWSNAVGLAGGFYASSDERIKTHKIISNSSNDLRTLMQLNVTDYQFRDSIAAGDAQVKGFIAQEVEKIYPQAVSKQTNWIPNIYQFAKNVMIDPASKEICFEITKPEEIKKGDKLKIITPNNLSVSKEVFAINGNVITLKDWTETTASLFVYGKEVDDFRIVDYDRIFTLGISSIQELGKQNNDLLKQLEDLKKNNVDMRALIESLTYKMALFEKDMTNIKASSATGQK